MEFPARTNSRGSLLDPATQGGLAAVQLADFLGEGDASPIALVSFDPTGALTSTPFSGGVSTISYFDPSTLLAMNNAGQGEMVCGFATLDLSAVWDENGDLESDRRSPGPIITQISPNKGLVGTATNVTITGARFTPNTTINAGTNIAVSNLQVISNSQMTATFTPTNSPSAGGNQPIRVTSNGSASDNSANFFVQVPMTFSEQSVFKDEDQAEIECPDKSQGFFAVVIYQLNDQHGSPILVAGLAPREQFFVNGVQALPDFQTFARPETTPATGIFADRPVGTCAQIVIPPPPFSPNFCVNVRQIFDVLVPTTGSGSLVRYPIQTTTIRRDCQQGIGLLVNPPTAMFIFGQVN